MLTIYGAINGSLAELPWQPGEPLPSEGVWIDLYDPAPLEEQAVENTLGIDIPTREELAEIEVSSRLYLEDGAAFMTATLIKRGEDERPEACPVTFILQRPLLITVRYAEPRAFPAFVRRASKPQRCPSSAEGILISLLEIIVDRAADHLEKVGQIVDETSRRIFQPLRSGKRTKALNLQELVRNIGEEGDFNSKMRESLVSIGRLTAFMTPVLDQVKQTRDFKELRARLKTLQRDIQSLTDHSTFLSGKINFMLDAVLGLITIEQNAIIKIFSVAAVVFLPPTLVASIYGMNFEFMPELHWTHGYAVAIGFMVVSALLPYLWFRWKGWL